MSAPSTAPRFTARVPGPDAEAIYSAAQWWWERCFMGEASVFTDTPLWTIETVSALHDALFTRPQKGRPRGFTDSLKAQLRDAQPELMGLAAEMLWLMMLFPTNVQAEAKADFVVEVWSWSGILLRDSSWLAPLRAQGIGSVEQEYNLYRWRELGYFLRLTLEWKTRQVKQLSPGNLWEVSDAFSAVKDSENGHFRHILLHILYPDAFEPVTSTSHKLAIREAFVEHLIEPARPLPKGPTRLTRVDQDLQQIRHALQEQNPDHRVDFYEPELYARWANFEPSETSDDSPNLSKNVQTIVAYAAALWKQARTNTQRDNGLLLGGVLLATVRARSDDAGGVLLRAIQAAEATGSTSSADAWILRIVQTVVGPDVELPGTSVPASFAVEGRYRFRHIIRAASALSSHTIPSANGEVHTRHIIGALVSPGAPQNVQRTLRGLGVDLTALRREMYEFFRASMPTDDLDAWRRVLIDGDTSAVRPNPGYSADDLHGDDQLGVADEARAFASVIASSSVQPPLSIGLFGDWGSGKSFFMRRMEKSIDQLSERARKARDRGQETAYCGSVVQIWFNAWHYIDANLWASLASHIFEKLADANVGAAEDPEAARKQLFSNLEASRAQLAEAENRKESALAAERAADKRVQDLKDVETSLHERMNAAADEAKALFKVGRDHPAVAELISRAADKLEIPESELLGRSLKEHAETIRGAWGSISMGFHIMKAKPRRWVTALVIVIVAAVLAVVAQSVLTRWGLDQVGAIITSAAAWLGMVAAAAKPWVDRARNAADTLKQADAEMEKQAATRREALERRQDRLAEEVTHLRVATAEAEQQRAEAERRVAEVEHEIEEIRAGRRLERFIQERSATDDYRRHLGIVAVIRRDFESLSKLLTEASAAHDGRPSVDRIILYVDDLDRCPEEGVVEVLQAIHLLLAFPLFVVVVGVDSRWLLRSVRRHFVGLIDAQHTDGRRVKPDGADDSVDAAAWGSTPQSYLEKIFQIPYSLRPMDDAGFGRLLGSLLPVRPERGQPEPTSPTSPQSGPTAEPIDGPSTPSAVEDEETQVEDEGVTSAGATDEGDQYGDVDDQDDEETGDPEMLPPGLELDSAELAFLGQLLPLIGSPRMAKRLANLYRFLRAGLTAEELDRFRGRGDVAGEHRPAALLLATLTGFPVEGPLLLRALASGEADGASPVLEFVEKLAADQAPSRRTNSAAADWIRLAMALRRLNPAALNGFTVDAAAPWAPRVARFSFQVPGAEA